MTTTGDLCADALRVVKTLDPAAMTGEEAARVVADLSVVEKAAATGRMFAAVRVAKTDAWRGQGHASAADWLAAQAGISVSAAHAQLGTARKANQLPKTKAAMDNGELSPDQAGAVTDGAAADPSAEDDLLEAAANDTNKALKDKAAKAKAAATDSAERERQIRRSRCRRIRIGGDGAGSLWIQGPAVDIVKLQALLRPFDEQVFRSGRTDGTRDTFDNRQYDSFFALVHHLTGIDFSTTLTAAPESGATPAPSSEPERVRAPAPGAAGPSPARTGHVMAPRDTGTDIDADPEATARATASATAPRPSPPAAAPKPPGGNNVKVIVRIDHAALARGHTIAGETCEVAGLGPIPVSAAKELMRDAFLAAVVTKGRDVVNVAHLGRGLSAHQRTAIEAMGLRCTNIACNKTIAIQIDHRVPYATEQITELSNQDPLCPDCHRRKTHHGWNLEPGHGARAFLPPDPTPTPTHGHATGPVTDAQADEIERRLKRRLGLGQPTRC
ncbi:HNH endonuclease signature motif containing protein [Aquihabitans sp. McL0605]|uniref:HNH endonuclease signature motif containing protein n=1 Tax=Aquihabitans sp. McL0605 TaxID=3415671 RepID=UPI003CF7069D